MHPLNFLKMFELFLAIMLAFAGPSHYTPTNCHHATGSTQNAPLDTGGDGGHVPPDPKG
jgi:hypothetical protein